MQHLTPTAPEPKHGLGAVMRRVKAAPNATAKDDAAWLSEELVGHPCPHCGEPLERWEVLNRQAYCTPCDQQLHPSVQTPEQVAESALVVRLLSCGVPPVYTSYLASSWRGAMPPEFARYMNEPKGFWYIYGDTGRGKTHLAVAAVDRLTVFGSRWVLFRDVPEALAEAKRLVGYADRSAGAAALEQSMRLMRDCQVLVFDDLGAERGTDYEQSVIGEVLRYRHMQEKATIITTNLAPDALRAIEPRIASRVTTQLVTHLGGRDRRAA